MNKVLEKVGIKPVLTETISPILDFRPGVGIPEKLKKRIKSTIKAVARDKERFGTFLENLAGLL